MKLIFSPVRFLGLNIYNNWYRKIQGIDIDNNILTVQITDPVSIGVFE